ncbi:DUF4190 domain-containing protein [Microbacterium sp. UFMG61]|uniref:DUF4190 domain-containing protein n=1 Tax=Microbacterium sp. UFMG61 TaxID=2745935 RepID=UPI00188E91B0|nr:DUF4190 domain-containing protein [Microbacterium sp. UFMG61]
MPPATGTLRATKGMIVSDTGNPLPWRETPPSAVPPAPPAPRVDAGPTQAYPGAAPSYSPPPAAPASGYAPAQPPHGTASQQQPGHPIYGGQYVPAPRPTSGLAVTSLICGIAGVVLFWLFLPMLASIVAVVTGHMALRQIKADPSLAGRGMAIAGVIMGYVMTAFLVLSLAITLISIVFFGAFTLPFIFAS